MEVNVKVYQKPLFRRVIGIDFVMKMIAGRFGVSCRQCSNCHGCR